LSLPVKSCKIMEAPRFYQISATKKDFSMHYFITVNGFATAGKNTAVDFMRNALADMNIPSIEYSSIEIVRRVLENSGIDISVKNDKTRYLLAEIGNILEKEYHIRSNDVIDCAKEFFDSCSKEHKSRSVFFTYTRENEVIDRLRSMVNNYLAYRTYDYNGSVPILYKTLFVTNTNVPKTMTNVVDRNVDSHYFYDHVIDNSGTKGQLLDACEALVKRLME
jgi:hypothetical protein